MTKRDVAIFGGTFNPVHNGHIDMINYLVDNYIVDEVWVLPSYVSPHKSITDIISYEDRVNMLELSTKNISNTIVKKNFMIKIMILLIRHIHTRYLKH